MEEWKPSRILIKNIYGGRLLEYFLIAAISSILGIRFYLNLTGYPQIGLLQLHIAHVLWGGLLMMAGVVFMLAYLSSNSRTIGAIVTGIGFGAFIDELGKFITSDNDYFFQPTAAIIYVLFVALFLLFRYFDRQQKISKEEYLANALELMEDLVFEDLDTDEKSRIKQFLKKSDQKNQFVISLRSLLEETETHHPGKPGILSRIKSDLAWRYQRLVLHPWFIRLLVIFFLLQALYSIAQAFQYGKLFLATNSNQFLDFSFSEAGELIAASFAGFLVLIGILNIFRDRLFSFRMFRYSILITILLVQFFEFYQNQFSAVGGLFGNILTLIALNYMITREVTIRTNKD